MRTLPFVKSEGAGNDFVIIDNRRGTAGRSQASLRALARRLCHRQQGIGADGLLLVEKAHGADFRMRIFNPDGSEPAMCGNGARCIALYARATGVADSTMRFATAAGLVSGWVKDGHACPPGQTGVAKRVRLGVSRPQGWRVVTGLPLQGRKATGYFINTGVPHVVLFPTALERVDVARRGRLIRNHRAFAPGGTNVDFVTVTDPHHLRLRTYERGVEAETLACGSGAVASAIAAWRVRGVASPVAVRTTGGEVLDVEWRSHGTAITDAYLTGPARLVYEGWIRI